MKAPIHAIALIATFCAFGQEAQQASVKAKPESPLAEAARAVAAVSEARSAEAEPTETKPAEAKPAETKPAEAKPVEAKAVETKPIEANPAEAAPVEAATAEPAPAEAAPAEVKPEEAEPAPVEQPAKVETAPIAATDNATNAATTRDTTDEIDLDEVDDSAEARGNAPVIAATETTNDKVTLVDISCDNATLEDVLRQFRKVTDANIISDDSTNLQRRVSVNLHHVAWLDGLQSILNSRSYRLEERGDIYFVREDKVADPILTRSFALNHASAKELADLFNQSYGKKDPKGAIILPIASSFDAANVVVVTATEKIIGECESIIKAVDKAVAQIYIEARFIELSNEALHKLGMQWNQLESWGASVRNLDGGWEYNNGRAANYGEPLSTRSTSSTSTSSDNKSANTSLSGSSSSSASSSSSTSTSLSDSRTYNGLVPSAIGSANGAGISAADMAWRNARGFSGQLSVDDFRLALSAFETMTDAKVFSNPKIIVSNGKEAKVDMTTKYPNVTINSDYTGLNSQNLSISTKLDVIPGEDKFMFAKEAFFSWGIQLSVTPRISPDGLISVEIVPTISDCTGYMQVNSSQETDTPYTQYPIIEVKRLTTEFTMQDGATAVIGGLSKTTEEDVDSGIPYLRRIPWIGQSIFGWKSRQKVQKEILVFVTIGIADPSRLPKDIGLPKNAILGREYVTGAKLEPGDHNGSALEVLSLDKRPIDKRKDKQAEESSDKSGEVIIKPVRKAPRPSAVPKEQKANLPAKPATQKTNAAKSTSKSSKHKTGAVEVKPVVLAQVAATTK